MNIFCNFALLHHAAAQNKDPLRILIFPMLQSPNISKHLKLRILPYRAGIEENQIGFFGRITEAISHFREKPVEFFTVADILLAAIGMGIG